MMWILGFITGAAITGAISVAVLMGRQEDKHLQYIKEWRRAQRAMYGRHPRSKKYQEAPLPLPLGGGWR